MVYTLTLENISANDLYDSGSFLDKQDPGIIIKIGKHVLKTERAKDGGTKAQYTEKFSNININDNEIKDIEIEIEVQNIDANGKSKADLGSYKAKLLDILIDDGKYHDVTINLTRQTKPKGQIKMQGLLVKEQAVELKAQPAPTLASPTSAPTPAPASSPSLAPNIAPARDEIISGPIYISFDQLSASELEDAGHMFDNQDPAMRIIITNSSQIFTTERIKEGGSKASFPETFNDIRSNYDDEIEIELHNMNDNKQSKKIVGKAKFKISDKIQKENVKVDLVIPLTNSKDKPQGKAMISAIIKKRDTSNEPDLKSTKQLDSKTTDSESKNSDSSSSKQSDSKVIESESKKMSSTVVPKKGKIKLNLDQLSVNGLDDAGNMFDKQDPSLNIKVGKKFAFQTKRITEGGTKASFPEIYSNIIANYDDYIEVEAHNTDANGISKKLLGIGKIRIYEAIKVEETKISFKIPLITSSNKEKGEVYMQGILWVIPVENPRIKLTLDEISVTDIYNSGNMLDKQDPCIKLKVGPFQFKTDRIKEGGTKCSFKETYKDLVVYNLDDIEVEVHNMDASGNSKALLGKGSIQISDAIPTPDEKLSFVIALMAPSNKLQGQVCIRGLVELFPALDPSTIKIEGPIKLSLDQLAIGDIENSGNLMNQQYPALHFKIQNFNFNTKRVQDEGTLVSFPERFEDIKTTYDTEIYLEVHNMNTDGNSSKLLGTGKFRVSDVLDRINSSIAFKVDLMNSSKTQKGSVYMRGKIEILPKGGPKLQGTVKLFLDQLAINNVYDSGNAFDVQDPQLTIKVGNYNYKTKRIVEGGGNTTFPESYQDMIVNADDDIEIEIHNVNADGESKGLVGKGKIKVSDAIESFDESCLFTLKVPNPKKEKESLKAQVSMRGKALVAPKADESMATIVGPIKLSLDKLSIADVADAGTIIDKQDPGMVIKISKYSFKTKRIVEGGTYAEFSETYQDLIVDMDDYLEVEVHNMDNAGESKKLLGKGKVKIRQVLTRMDERISFFVDLEYAPGKLKGRANITGKLEIAPAIDPNAPKIEGPIKLNLDQLSANGLINVGNLLDKQDPSMTIKVGKFGFKTKRHKEGGTSPIFPETYQDIIVDYGSGIIEVEIHNTDDSGSFKGLIGKGSIKISEVLRSVGVNTTFIIPLTNVTKSSKSSSAFGQVTMRGNIALLPIVDPNAPKIMGNVKLSLDKLTMNGVEDSGNLIDRQDPALRLRIKNFNFQTQRILDGGTSASFPEVYKDIIAKYDDDDIEVEVHNMDASGNSKKVLGRGSIKVSDAIQVLKEKVSFVIPLINSSKKEQGVVTMRGFLETAPEIEIVKRTGRIKLNIDNLSIFGVEDAGSIVDRQDPGMNIKIGKYNFKTNRVQEGGTATSFPETYNDVMVNYDDDIYVEVHNMDANGNSKKLLGRGTLKIYEGVVREGEAMSFNIQLTDSRNEKKGFAVMRGKVEVLKVVNHKIKLYLDNLSIRDVDNSGSLIDNQDPALFLKINKYSFKTKRIIEGGTTASFPETYNDIAVNYEDDIEVEVHNVDADSNSKNLLGRGLIRISDAITTFGETTTFLIPLTNTMGKAKGVVSLNGRAEKGTVKDATSAPLTGRIKLTLDQLAVSDIKNVGNLIDKQDPGLKIKIGKHILNTKRIANGGTSVSFPEVFKNISSLYEDDIEVEVHNLDDTGNSKQLIAKGKLKIAEAIDNPLSPRAFTIPLTNTSYEPEGSVTMRGIIEIPKVIDAKIKLSLSQLAINNIENSGHLLDKQDPAIHIRINKLRFKTERVKEGGVKCTFKEVYSNIKVNYDDDIDIEVHNMDGDDKSKKLLGKGTIKISEAVTVPGAVTSFKVPLTTSSGKQQGEVTMEGIVEIIVDDPNAKKIEGQVKISLDQLSICDVLNVGTAIDKQDPGVFLKIGKNVFTTKRIMDGGSDASFTEAFNDIIVDYRDEIEVEVHNMDGSGKSKKKLGKGSIKISDVFQKMDDSNVFSIDLVADGNQQKGQVMMRGILNAVPKDDPSAPKIEGLVKLSIDQLSANDLDDAGTFYDAQDPALIIKTGKYTFQTKRIVEGGTSSSFPETYSDIIVNYNDEIDVEAHNMDSNNMSKKLLGNGRIKISQLKSLNERKVLNIDLIDSSNNMKGRVSLRCKLESAPKRDPNSPKIEGLVKLNLDQLSASGLIDSGTAFDKQDPSLTFKIGKFTFKTNRVSEAGTSAAFPEVFNDIITNYDNGEIEVEVHNLDSNDKSKQLLGKGTVKISDAIQCLNEKILFIIPLQNSAVKSTTGFGQVVMRGVLSLGPKIDPNAPKISGKVKISIDQLAINDVYDSGTLIDKQDPQLSIRISNFNFKTKRVLEGGTSTSFPEEFKDIIANYDTDEITVEVNNIDGNGQSKFNLGVGKIKISEAFQVQNDYTTFTLDLKDKSGKVTKGNVIMRGKLDICKVKDPNTPELKGPIKMILDQICVNDIEDNGTVVDKQDPGVTIKLGKITYKTRRMPDAGTSASFPEVFKDIVTDYADNIEIEVHNFDSKGESKKKIGTGSIRIADAIQIEKEPTTFIIPLTNSSNKLQGTAIIRGTIETMEASTDTPITSKHVNLSLSKLLVNGADDTGNIFDKQDPAIRIKLSKHTFTTSRFHDGGSTASFAEKYNDIILETDELKSGLELFVEVLNLDDNGKTKKIVGKGSIRLLEAVPKIDNTAIFRIPITNSVGKVQGFVEMQGLLKVHIVIDEPKKEEASKAIEETKKAEAAKAVEEAKLEAAKKLEESKIQAQAATVESSKTISMLEEIAKKQADELSKLYKYIENVQKKQDEKAVQLQKQQEDQLKVLNQEFKKQLTTELSRERTRLLETINSKTESPAAMATYSAPPEPQPSPKKGTNTFAGISVSEMTNVKLPSDVCQWRTIHVQAWLAFKMELPMYMDAFQKASVDGLLLIRHISDEILTGDLGVDNELHRKKIMENVGKLRQKQDDLEEEAEKKRKTSILRAEAKEKLRQQQAEAEAKLAEERAKALALKIAEDNDKAAKEAEKRKKESSEGKSKETKKPKKVKKASTLSMIPNTIPADIREKNQLVRTKLGRVVGSMREREHDTAGGRRLVQQVMDQYNVNDKKMLKKTAIWAHEYNGAPKPEDNIWLTPSTGLAGSKEYQRAMILDVLGSNEFANSDISTIKRPARLDGPVKSIPKNCSPDEVITVIKGAMFEVSTWLLQLEELEIEKRKLQDSDLLVTDYQPEYEDYNNDNEVLDLESDREEDEEESVPPPPTYSQPIEKAVTTDDIINPDTINKDVAPIEPEYLTMPMSPSKTQRMLNSLDAKEYSIPDRMTLIYNAFVNQKRNKAQWLGENDKLTRSKFDGGIESILRVSMSWGQFDSLWTKLDYKRSGTLDLDEFKAFFGDLSEFERMEGNQTLDVNSKDRNISELANILYKLCDTLRHAGFTINEMFAGFDRNGSGSISISEFCSMLRLVIGNYGNKRLIYRALMTLDSDGDKQISLQELLIFIYKIWRTQLDELASRFGSELEGNPKLLHKIVKERQEIKDSIKKNFPREWRDRFERSPGGHSVTGPFNSLLSKMNINSSNFNETAISRPSSPSQRSPSPPRKGTPKFSIAAAGSNQLKRYKVKNQTDSIPVREGVVLGLPKTNSISVPKINITNELPDF